MEKQEELVCWDEYDDSEYSESMNSESFLSTSSDDDLSTTSNDGTDCDDAMILFVGKNNRNCIKKYLEEVVPSYTEQEFVRHFRISRTLYTNLCNKFTQDEAYQKLVAKKAYSADMHIALFLWFAGHEACSYRDIADRFDLSLGTVCNIIHRTLLFISNMADSVIRWPSDEEKKITSEHFKNKSGFKGVIGAIDGTHIRIDPPKRCKDDYMKRKNVISLHMQGICNEKKNLPMFSLGTRDPCTVLENSQIYEKLENLGGNYFVLGDSAYACKNFIITPFRNNGHLTPSQKMFNQKLSSARVIIEHTFGLLKQRFRQLYYCKIRGIENLCLFIRACAVLHNLCDQDDIETFNNKDIEIIDSLENVINDDLAGVSLRNRICEELFIQSREQD